MPGSRPLVQFAPLSVEIAYPIAHAPPSEIRPTWKAETIVAPFAKVSGSTSVLWFVSADAVHVVCVNGSELIGSTAARAAVARASAPRHAIPSAGTPR